MTSLKGPTMAALFTAASLLGTASLEAQDSPLTIRLRGIAVAPDVSSEITVIGGDVDVSTAYVPELDINLSLTPNVALELILATTKHDVSAVETALGTVDLGHVWLLPPTLLLQYHFLPEGPFSPYVGSGVNYTIFYSVDPGVVTDVEYDNAFGFALQAGADYFWDAQWGLNFDIKKLFLGTDATVDADGTTVVADTDLNPWIFGAGVVRRF